MTLRSLREAAEATGKDARTALHGGGPRDARYVPPNTVLPQPFRKIGAVGTARDNLTSRVRIDGVDLVSARLDHFRV